jgi:uncharacterized protein (TIGR03437 family)
VTKLNPAGSSSGTTFTAPIPIAGVSVTIGTASAQILAADLVAPGQYQINFVVPQVADGEYVITRVKIRPNIARKRVLRDRKVTIYCVTGRGREAAAD